MQALIMLGLLAAPVVLLGALVAAAVVRVGAETAPRK